MSIERSILIGITAIVLVSIFYIPQNKYRLALVSYLAFQALSWVAIIILVQIGSVKFPVREFPHATQAGFLLDFLFLPMIYAWSVLVSQNMVSIILKMIHNFIFISMMVWFIMFVSTYTELQRFTKGTFISQAIQLYIEFIIDFIACNIYILWFTKNERLSTGG